MELIEVKILNTTIDRVMNRQMGELGLTSAQSHVLVFLYLCKKDIVCQKDIEQALSLSHPTVSSILKRLEEKQMIITEAMEEDRRFKSIRLSEKCNDINRQLFEKVSAVYEQAVTGFSEEELCRFSDFLKRMNNNLQ